MFKGQSTINGSFVALKEIRLEHEEGAPCTAIREVSLLRQLKHANIVTLHDIIYTSKSLTLVFEYLVNDFPFNLFNIVIEIFYNMNEKYEEFFCSFYYYGISIALCNHFQVIKKLICLIYNGIFQETKNFCKKVIIFLYNYL